METLSLLRLPQVVKTCGLKKSAIYQRIQDGSFPAPLKLGSRSVAWRSDEIREWIESRPRTLEVKCDEINSNGDQA
jgi:prophage regulatory protein